jgi:hypothetical protein
MSWSNVKYMSDNRAFSLDSLKDGLVFVIIGNLEGELFSSQYANFLDNYKDISQSKVEILFVTQEYEETDKQNFICDTDRDLINLDPQLAKRSEIKSRHIFVFHKKGNETKVIFSKNAPDPEYNWVEYAMQLANNHLIVEADTDNLWRVAQIVTISGEYLCTDCGYIDNFTKGDIFPVCEVCLSGEPDGPKAIDLGYWELLK